MPLKFKNILIYFFLAVLIFAEFLLLKEDRSSDFLLPILIADLVFFLALATYNTNLCLNLVIMSLPFKLLYSYEIGIVTLDLYTVGVILLSAVCLIKIFLGQLSYKYIPSDITLILFTTVCLTFFITSNDIIKSGFVFFHTVFIPALTYFVIRILLTNEEKYSLFKLHFLLAVTIMAVLGCVEFFQSGQRIATTSGDALRGSLFFILAFFLLLSFRKKKHLIAGMVNLLAFVFGFCRVLLASFCLSPVFYLLSKKGFSKALFLFLAVSTLLFTIGMAGSKQITSQYNQFKREFQREHPFESLGAVGKTEKRLSDITFVKLSLASRVTAWREDLISFTSHPILGVGMGITRVQAASSHNLHVQLLAYTGLIGYSIFHLLLFQGMSSITEKRTDLLIRDFHFYSTAVFLIYLNGLGNGLFHGIFNYILFMVLALMQNLRFYTTALDNEENLYGR